MSDAEKLRAQKRASTDPERLERMARAEELFALAGRVEKEPASRELDAAILTALGHQTMTGIDSEWCWWPKGFTAGWLKPMPSPTTDARAVLFLVPKGKGYWRRVAGNETPRQSVVIALRTFAADLLAS